MSKILIADDDEMITTMLKFNFERAKYTVWLAADGNSAKEIITQEAPDIIITDLMMPFVSGLELINIVRNELSLNTPIIVLSTAGQENIILQAFKIGANDFVTKPFSPHELLVRIKRLLPSDSL